MAVTMEYVDTRFSEFAAKYQEVLKSLKFPESDIAKFVGWLTHRLTTRDFKLYGAKPINILHSGKRVTRFLIKQAIETCPAEKARRERLRAEYSARVTEARRLNPNGCFFSFESVYADKLKVNLAPVRDFFRM